jgi:hypothetical protein
VAALTPVSVDGMIVATLTILLAGLTRGKPQHLLRIDRPDLLPPTFDAHPVAKFYALRPDASASGRRSNLPKSANRFTRKALSHVDLLLCL